jgi:hypothetical protein
MSVGYVCSFGNLDSALDKLGDPEWGSGIDAESPLDKGKEKDEGVSSAAGIESEGEEVQQQHPHDFEEEVRAATRSSRNGKMEKSLLNFVVCLPLYTHTTHTFVSRISPWHTTLNRPHARTQEHYPTWQPARPGQRLLDNLSRHLNTSSRFGSSNEVRFIPSPTEAEHSPFLQSFSPSRVDGTEPGLVRAQLGAGRAGRLHGRTLGLVGQLGHGQLVGAVRGTKHAAAHRALGLVSPLRTPPTPSSTTRTALPSAL